MNQPFSPTIAVVGAGAVGSLIGGLLARQGHDVTLIGRPEHVAAINQSGLHINGISGDGTVSIKATDTLQFRPDLILLAVKSADVEIACEHIKPYADSAPIVTLQNGVRADEIAARYFGHKNIIGAVVLFNAQYLQPGTVTFGSKGALLIGTVFEANGEAAQNIAELFNMIVPTTLCDTIAGARWTKLLVNILGNNLDAMTGMSLQKCMEVEQLRQIGTLILQEALRVVSKARIELTELPSIPLKFFKFMSESPLPVASSAFQRVAQGIDTVSSTLQSLIRRKPTEIDYINGEIVILGKTINVPTPFNVKVVEVIHELERTHEFLSPVQIKSIFLA